MRKYIAMALALSLLLGLSACGQTEEKPNEETGDLFTIYLDESTAVLTDALVARYSQEYGLPKLDWNLVDCTSLSVEGMEQRLRKELQAGKGPDLIFINANTCADPERFLREVPLYDLAPTFQAGTPSLGITFDQLEEHCVQAGMLGEQLLLCPVTYQVPILLTTESVCKEAGIDLNKNTDLLSFLQMANQYYETHPNTSQSFLDQNGQLLEYSLRYGNLDLVDYDNKTVNSSNPKVEQIFAEYQKLAAYDQQATVRKVERQEGYFQLQERKNVFLSTHEDDPLYFWFDYQSLKLKETPVYDPVRDLTGGVQAIVKQSVAVNPNTKNPEAAVAVIETLLCQNFVLDPSLISGFPSHQESRQLFCGMFPSSHYLLPSSKYRAIAMPALDEQDPFYLSYFEAVQAITEAQFESALYANDGVFTNVFQPYFENNQSYEDSIAAFAKQAEAFLKGEQ